MIREITRVDADQIVVIERHYIEADVSMDKVIEEDHFMPITIEMTIEETISEISKNYRGKIFRGGYRRNYRNNNFWKR